MTRDQIIAMILELEGGYSNNPADPGGATNHGITQRYLDNARRTRPTLPVSVKDITPADATSLYAADQWQAVKGDSLPAHVAAVAFDGAVNEGPGTVVTLLQQALNLKVDGIMGPGTVAAATANPKAAQLLAAHRAAHYAKSAVARPAELEFVQGWMNRVLDVYTRGAQ
jgi:lysozyme family protein